MKKFKKIFAVLLTLAMVLGMSMTSFAKNITAPSANDTDTVSISGGGIKAHQVTFKAYRLIEPDFVAGKGFNGYKWVTPYGSGKIEIGTPDKINGLTNVKGLTSENITKWAANADKSVANQEVTWSGDVAQMELGVGTWMIIASPVEGVDVIYNPMIASIYYTQETSVTGGTVNAGGKWALATEDAYVKSEDRTNQGDKKVGTLDANGKFSQAAANAQVGQNRAYQLTGAIPSYSDEYFATLSGSAGTTTRTVKYTLKDSIVNGLQYNNDVVVKVGGTTIEDSSAGKTNYRLKWYSDNNFTTETTDVDEAKSFTVAFDPEYIKGLAGTTEAERAVEVTYTAKITQAAVSQVAENKFAIDYTRTPGVDDTSDIKTIYTFTAAINGAIKKVDEQNNVLGNATFTLYTENPTENENAAIFDTDTSDEIRDGVQITSNTGDTKGSVNFKGLAFDKEYYLKETAAPNGFSINNTVYKVVCTYPEGFDISGKTKLEKYNVTITNMTTGSTETKTVEVNYGDSASVLATAFPIVNTTLTSLPSTGGIGTTIFTIGGCAIMIIAAALFFASRRKAAK